MQLELKPNIFQNLRGLRDKEYFFNKNAYDDFYSQNRKHQIQAVIEAGKHKIGQIISPCGTGKSRIQACIHVKDMIEKFHNNETGIYLIASHRLALNKQLIDNLISLVVKCGLPFNILYVGSGRPSFDDYYGKYAKYGFTAKQCRVLSSLQKNKIDEFCKESKRLNRNVIVVSTYHSIDILSSLQIDIATFDEAHNTTERRHNDNIKPIKHNISRTYFFTATRKVLGEDGGMNDESFYGKVIYDANPATMLDDGEIVEPKVHVIDSDDDEFKTKHTNSNMKIKNVIEAYDHHSSKVSKPGIIEAKLLISFSGIDEMMSICNNVEFEKFCNENKIKLFSISSDGIRLNNENIGAIDFFKELNSLADTDKAIICNVDMLTEGIDLPTITGVMPMRNMSITKLFQLFGRALRLHPNDRKNIYNKIICQTDKEKYIKPYGWLIIPRHLATMDNFKEMEDYILKVWQEYKSPIEEMVIQERFIKMEEDTLSSMLERDMSSNEDSELNHSEYNIVNRQRQREIIKQIEQDPFKFMEDFLNGK